MVKKKILLVVDLKVIDLYKQLIEKLLENYKIIIIVLENYKNDNYFKQKDIFDKLDIEFHLYTELFQKVYPTRFKGKNSLTHYLVELTTTLKYKYSYNLSLQYLLSKNIHILLHTQDISLSNIGLLKAAYDLNIPSILPSAIMMEPDDYFHKDKAQYSTHKDSTLYEKYVFNKEYGEDIKYNNLFFYTAPVLNFLKKFDLLSKTPWIYGGSKHTKYLCVSNLYHKNVSTKHGIDESKIKIVGDVNYDKLYLSYSKHNMAKKRNIIVLAVPQFFEHNYCSFTEAKKRIEHLLQTTSSVKKYELILSLHPSMPKYKYAYLEKQFDCKISDKPLYEILPMAELFICTQSNTIIWSTLCHVKTLVADFYGWEYSTSQQLTSCKVIKQKEDFNKNSINTMLSENVDFKHDDKLLSRDLVFSGKVLESYAKLISSTIDTRKIKKDEVKKYFIPFAHLYFKYKKNKKNKKMKQLENLVQEYDKFYIAPYNDISCHFQETLNNNKFSGYIDNYQDNIYTKNIENIDLSNSCILILSPNYDKEIYNSLKNKTKNLYIVRF